LETERKKGKGKWKSGIAVIEISWKEKVLFSISIMKKKNLNFATRTICKTSQEKLRLVLDNISAVIF
jgi:hypothetical protein